MEGMCKRGRGEGSARERGGGRGHKKGKKDAQETVGRRGSRGEWGGHKGEEIKERREGEHARCI